MFGRLRFSSQLWLCVFLTTVCIAVSVQTFVLPVLFPQWHAGNGLLLGSDSVAYHRDAANLASRIHEHGWEAWRTPPAVPPIVGLLALLYVLVAPTPLVLVPVNAALQATAILMLWRIVRRLLPDARLAALCVAPAVLSPTAVLWNSQILKDGFSFAGTLLFLDGWLGVDDALRARDAKGTALAAVRCIVGALLGWFLRPYTVLLTQAAAIVMLLVGAAFSMVAARRPAARNRVALNAVLAWLVIIVALVPFTRLDAFGSGLADSTTPSAGGRARARPANIAAEPGWQPTKWIPGGIERLFKVVSSVREGFRLSYPDAKSMIDTDVRFHSVADLVRYGPRALQVGLLSPFPGQLAGKPGEASGLMRRVAGFEIVFIYVALAGLFVAFRRWRKSLPMWVVPAFCVVFIEIYALTIPNLGSLFRVRFPYVETLTALGIAGYLSLIPGAAANSDAVLAAASVEVHTPASG